MKWFTHAAVVGGFYLVLATGCLTGCTSTPAATPPTTVQVAPVCPAAGAAPASVTTAPAPRTVTAMPYDMPGAEDGFLAPPPLPGASGAGAEPVLIVFMVAITKTGAISVDGRRIEGDDLPRLAREAKAKEPSLRALITADRDASWSSVVLVFDRLKQAGITKLAFGVQAMSSPR